MFFPEKALNMDEKNVMEIFESAGPEELRQIHF